MNQYSAQPPKNDNSKPIMIGIVIAVIVILIGVIIVLVSKNPSTPTGENTGGNVPVTPTNNPTTYKTTFGNFTLEIPESLICEKKYIDGTERLLVTDNNTWQALISIVDKSYEDVKKQKNNIHINIMKSLNGVATLAKQSTYAGYELITTDYDIAGNKGVIGYGRATSSLVFGVEIVTVDNTADYDKFNTIAPILKSAKYKAESNSIKNDSKIDLGNLIK